MAEIKHPKLTMEKSLGSLERAFAEDAFEALSMYGVIEEDVHPGGTTVCFKVTDRYDAKTETGHCAIRLRSVVSIDVMYAGSADAGGTLDFSNSSDTYKVIMLEYVDLGDLYDEEEPIVDADLEWEEYVLVVIDETDLDEISVLDAKTGKDLSQNDLIEAAYVLRQLKDDLKSMCYEEDVEAVGMGFEIYRAINDDEFNPAEFISSYECPECKTGFAFCDHAENSAWKN